MSERGVHVSIARARAGAIMDAAGPPGADEILAALREVVDPELPMVSIVDMGMVGNVEFRPTAPGRPAALRVEILPTFVGCPALELIREAAVTRLSTFGWPVEVDLAYRPPWTTDRITADGLRALAAAGVAGPPAGSAARCPWCGSERTVMDSAFGPTQCRSLHYCRDCRQPFEALRDA